jgi:hypothetical protein
VRRGADALLGALLLTLLAISLPLGIHFWGDRRELRVDLRSAEPHEIAPHPRQFTPAPAVAGPPELLPRLELSGAPDRADPGLWLRTWQVTYGRRWERQVTVPVLAGPFDPEGRPWPCSLAVRLSPRFFDDGKPGGEDVESVVDRVVRAQFPFTVLGLRFAPVSNTSLHVRPIEGALEVSGGVVLADAVRDPTQFSIKARIVLGERGGDLTARLENVAVGWRGRTRHDPLVALASMFMDVDEQARSIVSEKLGGALTIMRLPREPFAPFDDRPRDRVWVRLCDAPEVHPSGLTVRLRTVVRLAEPRLDPTVAGPPHLEARPELGPVDPGEAQPLLEVSASAAAAQQALYVMWQAGELAAWGRRPDAIAAMRDKVQDRLSFDLESLDPRLPPVILPEGEGDAFRVRFGDLSLGRAGAQGERRVAAHGEILARARVASGRLGLAGTISDLRVSCVEGSPERWRLRPCFSDVVPVLRESGITGEGLPLDLAIPDRLLRFSLVMGTDLVVDNLEGTMSGSPPALHLRAEARLSRRGKDR